MKYTLNNTDFFLLRSDTVEKTDSYIIDNQLQKFPFFRMSKNIDTTSLDQNMLLFPDGYMLDPIRYSYIQQDLKQDIPFDAKNKTAIFRGSTTGHNCIFTDINRLNICPRLRLIIQSQYCNNDVDAKFSSSYMWIKDKLAPYTCCYPQSISNHLSHRYIISQDGHTSAWLRVPWILQSNSLLVKEEEKTIQWFYPILKPNYHYIPFYSTDNICSIIKEVNNFEFVIINELADNSKNLGIDILSEEKILEYTASILNRYSNFITINDSIYFDKQNDLLYGKGLDDSILELSLLLTYITFNAVETNIVDASSLEMSKGLINNIGDGWL